MTKSKMDANVADQTIEQLQERYRDLHTKKIQADTNLENAKAKLEELNAEALEEFGTSDVVELRDILRRGRLRTKKNGRPTNPSLIGSRRILRMSRRIWATLATRRPIPRRSLDAGRRVECLRFVAQLWTPRSG